VRLTLATLLLCLRELRRHPLRSALTMLGVVVGVASVVAMVTLGRGVTTKITDEVKELGSNLLIVLPRTATLEADAGAKPLRQEDAEAIARELPTVRSVAPTQNMTVELSVGGKPLTVGVIGTTADYFVARGYSLAEGETFSPTQARSARPICVLGATVARELRQRGSDTRRVRIGGFPYEVVGVLRAKGQGSLGDDPDNVVVVPLATMRHRLTGTDALQGVLITALGNHSTATLKRSVEALLRERHRVAPGTDLPDDFTVQDMQELMSTLTTISSVLSALLGAIAGVSLVVGGIGIMNIMLVSVSERTNEIGMRLAIGATDQDVLRQFLLEAVLLSSLGGLIGVAVGFATSGIVALLLSVPFVLDWDIVALAVTVSVSVGLIFGVLPARRAARLHPVEALRHV
jgi:putative ABC transport system permease protein